MFSPLAGTLLLSFCFQITFSSADAGTTCIPASLAFEDLPESPFTSVTANIQKATACSVLPTPTSDLHFVALNVTNSTESTDGILFGANGTSAAYLSTTMNGISFIFDFSSDRRLGVVGDDGSSLYFDSDGMYFTTPGCSFVFNMTMPNFVDQITEGENSSVLMRDLRHQKRFTETTFDVSLLLEDQCGNILPDMDASLSLGPTPCTAVQRQVADGEYLFSCQFPGELSAEMQCEKSMHEITDKLVGFTPTATISAWPAMAKRLFQFLLVRKKSWLVWLAITAGLLLSEEEIAALAALAPIIEGVADAVAISQAGIIAWNVNHPEGIEQDICTFLHKDGFPMDLILNAGPYTYTVTSLSAAPTSQISRATTVQDECDQTPPSPPVVTTPAVVPVAAGPTVVPPTRTCTSDCGWQWVASGAWGQWSANSWSLPTPFFINDAQGQLTLNTDCVSPKEVDSSIDTIPANSGYGWEDWPLGSDTADSCCLEYFANTGCQRVAGGFVDQCIGTVDEADTTTDHALFQVMSFRVYGCRGLWTGSS